MLKVRVTAVLYGQNYRIKPVPAGADMTQDVGLRADGTLGTYPPKLQMTSEGSILVIKTVGDNNAKEGQ